MTGAGAPPVIDLNADLGESFGMWRLGDDEALLTLVTSANVACGFHAGDPLTLQRTCANAVAGGVAIGAQVSYRDLAGFGRREMVVPPAELTAEVLYQIAALDGIARVRGRPGQLRQAARRAVQPGHPRSGPGEGDRRGGLPVRPGPAAADPAAR